MNRLLCSGFVEMKWTGRYLVFFSFQMIQFDSKDTFKLTGPSLISILFECDWVREIAEINISICIWCGCMVSFTWHFFFSFFFVVASNESQSKYWMKKKSTMLVYRKLNLLCFLFKHENILQGWIVDSVRNGSKCKYWVVNTNISV